ncbi:uncharacterized protein LOC143045994 isoform X3 [Mytilus galloprovincialis]|uniref:uncharacterized protein LOC143045994 isoform X3 n=1 Tax=Mytilus galloprovincialis TaxID=29158 RepID=UPI003F7C1EAF
MKQEGKDKQFLLAKMHDITGEPKQKPKKHQPPPPPTVNTVNEAEDIHANSVAMNDDEEQNKNTLKLNDLYRHHVNLNDENECEQVENNANQHISPNRSRNDLRSASNVHIGEPVSKSGTSSSAESQLPKSTIDNLDW